MLLSYLDMFIALCNYINSLWVVYMQGSITIEMHLEDLPFDDIHKKKTRFVFSTFY